MKERPTSLYGQVEAYAEKRASAQLAGKDIFPISATDQTVLRNTQGEIVWCISGLLPEFNRRILGSNIRGLFLERYPGFNRLFPKEEDGTIRKEKRIEAGKFILSMVDSDRSFARIFGKDALEKMYLYKETEYTRWIVLDAAFRGLGVLLGNVTEDRDGEEIERKILGRFRPFSPGLVLAITRQLKDKMLVELPHSYIFKSQGWVLLGENNGIRKDEGYIPRCVFEGVAGELVSGYPCEYQLGVCISGHWTGYGIFISPELVDRTVAEAEKMKLVIPKGWDTVEEVRRKYFLGTHFSTLRSGVDMGTVIERILAKLRDKCLDQSRVIPIDREMKTDIFYSPGLTEMVGEFIKSEEAEYLEENKNRGEFSFTGLRNEVKNRTGKIFGPTLRTLTKRISQNQPGLVRTGTNTPYTRELLDLLVVELKEKYLDPEEGWETVYRVGRRLRVSDKRVQEIADSFRGARPEWFRYFTSDQVSREHLSPELITEIEKQVNNVKAKGDVAVTPEEANAIFDRLFGN